MDPNDNPPDPAAVKGEAIDGAALQMLLHGLTGQALADGCTYGEVIAALEIAKLHIYDEAKNDKIAQAEAQRPRIITPDP